MNVDTTIKAEEARRLKNDTAFLDFIQDVRDDQIRVFTTSGVNDIELREEAHAILRAIEQLQSKLDAAIDAQTIESKMR